MTKLATRCRVLPLVFATAVGAGGCQDEGTTPPDDMPPMPTSYEFSSRFASGESAVSYSGQTLRQTLVLELSAYLGGLTNRVDTSPPADDEVLAGLTFYLDFDSSVGGATPLTMSTTPPPMQATFDDVSAGKDLRSKLAGNDTATDHKSWNTPGQFQGWSEGGTASDTPTELIEYWFAELDDLAVARGQGIIPIGADGVPIAKVQVTERGQDLTELIQKFLLGALAYQQGLDDYLDDATEGKGLLSTNLPEDGAAFSELEHSWDEAFGYFGPARDYADYTDDELARKGGRESYQGYHDTNADGLIDLQSEYNFGHSVNCAKRDRGSSAEAPTDYTSDAFRAFVAGRYIIWSADGELDTQQLAALIEQRDIISETWEKCLSSTMVHYINELLEDMNRFGTEEYDFASHAKHWSELKGFALGLQFNPRSPLQQGTRFADLHALIGDAPVLPNDPGGQGAIDGYRSSLLEARDLLQSAYGFAAANVEAW